jgi:hypothetical protein
MNCWQIGLRHRFSRRERSVANKNENTINDSISTGFNII